MELIINIGNSNVRLGVFDGNECLTSWVANTKNIQKEAGFLDKIEEQYRLYEMDAKHTIDKIVIGSVVPDLTESIAQRIGDYHGIAPILVNRNSPSAVKHHSNQIGTDLYANGVAAHHLYQGNKIILDFGTALTLSCIDTSGVFQGVVIAPGVETSLNALVAQTAQLPEIPIKKPNKVLGKNTLACMQSGVVYGFLSMVEGLIDRTINEVGADCFVVATGGLGHIFSPLTESIQVFDRLHTLKGLRILGQQS